MRNKPWSIIVLSLLHALSPLVMVLFWASYYHMSPIVFVQKLVQTYSGQKLFETFALLPIAGYTIWRCRNWSYPVFILIQGWLLFSKYKYLIFLWKTNQFFLGYVFLTFMILSILVVGYFLLPAVRLTYFDPRVRWWEAKPRYRHDIDCSLDETTKGVVRNVSETGIFVSTDKELEIDTIIDINFKFAEQDLHVKGKVVHKFNYGEFHGWGVQFQFMNHKLKTKIRKITKELDRIGAERNPPHRVLWKDFLQWLKGLAKGKGLVPEKDTIK